MKHRKPIQIGLLLGLLLIGLPALAGDNDNEKVSELTEARMEGQLWATFALNRHLDPFHLTVDVDNDIATLEGEVDETAKKELAEQIALSVDGIDRVENKVQVNQKLAASSPPADGDGKRSFGDRVSDATTTATIKSKLLWNQSTSGLSINVDTENGVVELEGEADSEASRDLAEQLAINTDDVVDVINNIKVVHSKQARANN